MAKTGFFGGNPEVIMKTKISIVMETFHFNKFIEDYQSEAMEFSRQEQEAQRQGR